MSLFHPKSMFISPGLLSAAICLFPKEPSPMWAEQECLLACFGVPVLFCWLGEQRHAGPVWSPKSHLGGLAKL